MDDSGERAKEIVESSGVIVCAASVSTPRAVGRRIVQGEEVERGRGNECGWWARATSAFL